MSVRLFPRDKFGDGKWVAGYRGKRGRARNSRMHVGTRVAPMVLVIFYGLYERVNRPRDGCLLTVLKYTRNVCALETKSRGDSSCRSAGAGYFHVDAWNEKKEERRRRKEKDSRANSRRASAVPIIFHQRGSRQDEGKIDDRHWPSSRNASRVILRRLDRIINTESNYTWRILTIKILSQRIRIVVLFVINHFEWIPGIVNNVTEWFVSVYQ